MNAGDRWDEAVQLIDAFVAQHMDEGNVPGLALALTDRERVVAARAYGFADAAARVPVADGTLFEIGSIGKSFTAIGLLQLAEEGRIDLQAPVARYLPWFSVRSDHPPITVHHLLSHSGGLPMGSDFGAGSIYEAYALRECEVGCAPGERFWYSNVGYKLLGHLLQTIAGRPYGAILQERILDPAGMTATWPIITNDLRARLAVGHVPYYDDRPAPAAFPQAPAPWLEYDAGDGSPACTATDLAEYLRMLLNRGRGVHGRILSEQAFDQLTQPAIATPVAFEGACYGYGLYVGEQPEHHRHRMIGHGGGTVGYQSFMHGDLNDGIGAVALINSSSGSASAHAVAEFALHALRAGVKGTEMPVVPSRANRFVVDNAAEYAGVYRGVKGSIGVVAEGTRLRLQYEGAAIPLERRGPDAFYAAHPAFARAYVCFGREEGRVVEITHGAEWYTHERYEGPREFAYPREWDAYVGQYRAYNPWFSNFRVFVRKGALYLVWHGRQSGRLHPLGNGRFRLYDDAWSPERVRFDTAIEGRTLRALISGGAFYRVGEP